MWKDKCGTVKCQSWPTALTEKELYIHTYIINMCRLNKRAVEHKIDRESSPYLGYSKNHDRAIIEVSYHNYKHDLSTIYA